LGVVLLSFLYEAPQIPPQLAAGRAAAWLTQATDFGHEFQETRESNKNEPSRGLVAISVQRQDVDFAFQCLKALSSFIALAI
jgi:hypothetical protein